MQICWQPLLNNHSAGAQIDTDFALVRLALIANQQFAWYDAALQMKPGAS
jgi:hypothetical protein